MNLVRRNIIANFVGTIWIALLSMAFMPAYVHFMGIEAYGLLGIFTSLLAMFGVLDMGLSPTLNRELARLSGNQEQAQEMRDIVRTLELPYWLVGVGLCLIVVSLSSLIANQWLNLQHLSADSTQNAVAIMGLAIGFQWPTSFYSGGLRGLQRQVLLNVILSVMATLRGGGAVLVLWLISPTAEAFFLWQVVVSALQISVIMLSLWWCLPRAPGPPRFRLMLLRSIWRFALGVTGITGLAAVLMQLDKVILSRMLTLSAFGYYTLAGAVGISLGRVVAPVFQATYPRFTNLMTAGDTEQVTRLYHKSAQLVSVFLLPATLMLALFAPEVMQLWTQSATTTENTHLLVSILVVGTALQGIMVVPYALQLAAGWTRLSLVANLISVLVLVPLMIVLARSFGAVGAACVWPLLNIGYVLLIIPVMHRRLLPGEKWRWYTRDIGAPLLAAAVVCAAGRLVIRPDWQPLVLLGGLLGLGTAATLAACCAADKLNFLSQLRRFSSNTRPAPR